MIYPYGTNMYCIHCSYAYPAEPPVWQHPEYKDLSKNMYAMASHVTKHPEFITKFRDCPNAGEWFKFPEAVRLMDKESV